MSRISTLIRDHCPRGVTYGPIGSVADIPSARLDVASLDKSTYVGVDNLLPDFGGRRDSDYLPTSGGALRFQPGDVLIGNIRPYLKKVWYADRAGGASPDVVTLTPRPSVRDPLVPRFLYHLIASDEFINYSTQHAKGGKMPRGDKAAVLRYRIPIPPTPVQEEVVRVLDSFMSLETALNVELEARRRQFAYYRDQLMIFRGASGVEWIPMGELGHFTRGARFTKDDIVEDGIPSIHYGEIYTKYGTAARTTVSRVRRDLYARLRFAAPDDVVIATVGETVEDVAKAVAWLGNEPVAIHDDTLAFSSDMNPRFVSYAMQTAEFHAQKNQHVARAKVKRIGADALAKILIPVPPSIDEQDSVVLVLEAFDLLVNDPSVGLPAEIKARRAQFEYYRGKLLAFEETAA